MRILHLLSQNHLTGAEVYAVNLIQNQVQNSHLVWQISNDFFSKSLGVQIRWPVETRSTVDFLKSVLKLREFLKENRIHVVHCHSRAAAKLCYFARMFLHVSDDFGSTYKVAQVSTIHGRQHVSASKKLHNQYGEFLIPVCENIAVQLQSEFKYNPSRIKLIRNAVNARLFRPPKTGIVKSSGRALKIAVIGRCTGPKKNRTEIFLAQAHEILQFKKIDHEFFVVGDDSHKLNTTVPVRAFENASIQFEFLSQFDLICGSGRVAVEAALAEIPCIAFGEYNFSGLLSLQNLLANLQTNFGDIGPDFSGPHSNSTDIHRAVELWLVKRNHSAFNIELSEIAKKIENEFSDQRVQSQIERLYESAFFLRQYAKWIPILMYHKVPDQVLQSPHKIFVTKTNFEKHLSSFKLFGLKTLTFSDLEKFRKGKRSWKNFPRRPLILTFDDGYRDNLLNASPLLLRAGYKAQLFLLADSTFKSNSWDHGPHESGDAIVSGSERQDWLMSAFEIGSHGIKHVHLPEIPIEDAHREITESKKRLEAEFRTPINVYAFTYGETNQDLAQIAQTAGYSYAVNTDSGGLNMEENPFAIFRVNIFPDESLFSLWKKTSSWYRNYYFKKRGK